MTDLPVGSVPLKKRFLGNPLTLIGLILLGGGGPLLTVYLNAEIPDHQTAALAMLGVLVFLTFGFFVAVLWLKPTHLYAPFDYPPDTQWGDVYGRADRGAEAKAALAEKRRAADWEKLQAQIDDLVVRLGKQEKDSPGLKEQIEALVTVAVKQARDTEAAIGRSGIEQARDVILRWLAESVRIAGGGSTVVPVNALMESAQAPAATRADFEAAWEEMCAEGVGTYVANFLGSPWVALSGAQAAAVAQRIREQG